MNHKGMKGSESRNNLWEPEWATNGSYFVFRKLEQDVEAFHKYVSAIITHIHY